MTFAILDLWFAPAASDSGGASERRSGRTPVDAPGGTTASSASAALPGDDAALVARVRAGDAAALETIFRRHAPQLLRFAERQLGSGEAADDVVQDVFLSVWRIRTTWHVRTSLATYLFQASRHRIASRARRRAGEDPQAGAAQLTADMAGAPDAAPDAVLELAELRGAVERAIASLSPKTREVFELSRDAGLTYREISAVLGVSVKTVEMHVGRALAALRAALGPWRR